MIKPWPPQKKLRLIADGGGIGLGLDWWRQAAKESVVEIERLRKIEAAARALKFSAYPAHGSGFVISVTGGNINDLEAALKD